MSFNVKKIPLLLILSRLIIAIIIPFIGFYSNSAGVIIVALMIFGLLTDIFDGIIARKLNCATEKLRIYDSNVDVVFWIAIIATLFTLNFTFFRENLTAIIIVFGLEILCYILSFAKFKKTIATHSLLAKLWTLTLIVFLIDLALNQTSYTFYWICIIIGIISRIEIILMILFLKKWTTDIPYLAAVFKINKGLPFKKSKLFNG